MRQKSFSLHKFGRANIYFLLDVLSRLSHYEFSNFMDKTLMSQLLCYTVHRYEQRTTIFHSTYCVHIFLYRLRTKL